MKIITILSILFLLPTTYFAQSTVKINGVQFYKSITVGGESLQVNGGGLREKYWIDLYVAALYLKEKSSDAVKVIQGNEEMGIHIYLVSDKVTRAKFIETLNEGFKVATAGSASKEQIAEFSGFFSDEFKKGDKIYLDFEPSKGLIVKKNGKQVGVLDSLEFKKALFSIWLGSKTVDETLKNGMLGK